MAGLRALVVDDNATNRKVVGEMLSSWGMKPTIVENGRAALTAMLEQAQTGEPFKLILIDCMMPEMDGFELAEKTALRCRVSRARKS